MWHIFLWRSSFSFPKVCASEIYEQPQGVRYQNGAMSVQRVASIGERLLLLQTFDDRMVDNLQLEVMVLIPLVCLWTKNLIYYEVANHWTARLLEHRSKWENFYFVEFINV